MEKIGMTHSPEDDFQHPLLQEGDRLPSAMSSTGWLDLHFSLT
jgi:hypothetical protein